MIRHTRSVNRCGFTLIELLIVIAIILILIAIALPNFLEAQIRAKVARARADLRVLSIAMEGYYGDRGIYPYTSYARLDLSPSSDGLRWLTSPVAYLKTLPIDPFSEEIAGSGRLYNMGPNYKLQSTSPPPWPNVSRFTRVDAYYLFSFGPDRDKDSAFGSQTWPFSKLANPCARGGRPRNSTVDFKSYSPTNGARSLGEIFHFGGEFRAGNWCLDGVHILGRDSHLYAAYG